MKIDKVTPWFKAGGKHDYTNYRRVSSLFSFFREKGSYLLNGLRIPLLNVTHCVIVRSSQSISLSLMEFVEEMMNAVDKKTFTREVFTDLTQILIQLTMEYYLKHWKHRGLGE